MEYSVGGVEVHEASGTAWLDAQLSDGTGWKSPVQSTPKQTLSQPSAMLSTQLPLKGLAATLNRVTALTGLSSDGTYTLTPHIALTGTVNGRPFSNEFTSPIQIGLGPTLIEFPENLSTNQSGSVSTPGILPNTLSLGPVKLSVGTARVIAGILLLAGIIITGLGVQGRRRNVPPDELTALLNKFHRHLVPAISAHVPPDRPFIDVPELPELIRLAQRCDQYVLHLERDHIFLLPTPSGVYRYCPPADQALVPGQRSADPASALRASEDWAADCRYFPPK